MTRRSGRVCAGALLNGALAPGPNWVHPTADKSLLGPADPWEIYTVEAHRRWRGRNKKLIDDPPQLEEQWMQDLKRKVAERTEPKPQRFWSNISSRGAVKQKNR